MRRRDRVHQLVHVTADPEGGGDAGHALTARHAPAITERWDVRGTLALDEFLLARDHHGRPTPRRRALAGVAVEVLGFPDARALRSPLGVAVTDGDGRFRVSAERPRWAQELQLRVRFGDAALAVGTRDVDGTLAPPRWRAVVATDGPARGPRVDLGPVVFAAGAAGALDRLAADATAWYVARAAQSFLFDGVFDGAFDRAPTAVEPLTVPASTDAGATLRRVVRWWVRARGAELPVAPAADALRRLLWPTYVPLGVRAAG